MAKDTKQIDIEQQFINLLLNHKDLVMDWLDSNLKVFHFDSSHRIILKAIENSFSQDDSVLTKNSFIDFVKKVATSDSEVNGQIFLYDKISILGAERGDFTLLNNKILERFVKVNAIKYIDEFTQNLDQEGSLTAIKSLSEKITGLTLDTTIKSKIIYEDIAPYSKVFLEDIKKRKALGPEEDKKIIRCGIREIDDTLGTGFCPGTLTLFTADSSTFKSTIMLNVGLNVWKNGFNVLFVPLEMPRDKMYQKALSREARIPFGRIEKPYLLDDDEIKKLEEETEKISAPKENKFYIMESYERVPVSMVRRQIEKNIDIFKPNLVVIDYIANLTSEDRYQRESQTIQIGEMIKDLRAMGKQGGLHDKGFAIVSGAQVGREALKRIRKTGTQKASFNSEDIKDSHSYVTDSDNVYAQMRDEAQPNSRLLLWVLKSRYGPKTFANGESKASLEVIPEIGLIQSINDTWYDDTSEDVLSKAEIKPEEIGINPSSKKHIESPNKTISTSHSNVVSDSNAVSDDLS